MRAKIFCLVVGVALSLAVRPEDSQDWRRAALASFDEAWQAIHDTYHDPTFGGLDWQAVRAELRPRAEAGASPDEVRGVIRQMLARFGQSHFVLMSARAADERVRGEARVLVDIRPAGADIVITRVEPESAAAAAGLQPGQLIRRVDDEPAARWFDGAEGPDEHARAVDATGRAAAALSGPAGSAVTMIVADGHGEREVRVARERERGQAVKFGHLPPLAVRVDAHERVTPAGRQAGVIAFNVWMPTASAAIDRAVDRFRDADGLVIDLRGNPGGLVEMMRGVAGHLIDEDVPLGRLQTREAGLELRVNPRRSTPDGRTVRPFAGPVAILVDEMTASASECFAGSLQSLGRARVFGRRSMGQALPAATRRLASGDVLMHVVGDFVTPTGARLEGAGVAPDEVVPLSIEALRAGRDEALSAALGWFDRVAASAALHLP